MATFKSESVVTIGSKKPPITFVQWSSGSWMGYKVGDPFHAPSFMQRNDESKEEFQKRVEQENQ